MSPFTADEVEYLTTGERRLARIATIGPDGQPHVTPVGYTYNRQHGTIDVGGIRLTKTKKFRDLLTNSNVALVIDDVLPPWHPRGVEIRGRAETIDEPTPLIRVHPDRIVSWGLERVEPERRRARRVVRAEESDVSSSTPEP